MKIIFVVNNLGVGGAQKMAKYVCHSLSEFHHCKIVGLFSRQNIESSEDTIQLCPPRSSYFIVLRKLRSLLKVENPDLVVAFGTDSVVLSYIASCGLKIKIVGSERNDPSQLSFPWLMASRFIYPKCDGFSFQLEKVMSFYHMNSSTTVQVIPNAYFGKSYNSFIKAKYRTKEVACVSARVDHQKGLDVLLRAFKIVHNTYPEYKLTIYGRLTNWSELTALISELGIEQFVVFKGQTDCLSDSIHASRCFVLPSRFEGIPNALIEALASGVPTVSCDCPPGGPRMLTENGKCGLLCDVEDVEGMAKRICQLIEDDDLCNSLSGKAQLVQERFEASRITEKWKCLCESVFDL